MSNLSLKYHNEVIPKLKAEFSLSHDLAVPTIEKIVLNMGLVEAASNKEALGKAKEQLAIIAGQSPRITRAKKSISSFKLRQGDTIGLMVTLRGKKAWDFLEKLVAIVMPRMRDFRGLSEVSFDKAGNYSLGLSEQNLFPEIDFAKIDKNRGLVITIVVKNSDLNKSKKLLELLGAPFRK